MSKKTVVCEYVGCGHPDKLADQIADAILDECLKEDENTRAGIEVMVKDNIVVLGGELTTRTESVNYEKVVKRVFEDIKYPANHNLNPRGIKVLNLMGQQSAEINRGVEKINDLCAGDQGFMVGFASDETIEYMPLGHAIARDLCLLIPTTRDCLGPDIKSQVVIEYDTENHTERIVSVLVSVQHQCSIEECRHLVSICIDDYLKENNLMRIADKCEIQVNPCGEWTIGGPVADCGVTGRKIVVDQFGGYCNVGGGAFSGKDPSKVDRSGAYMARYIAKHIVSSGLGHNCKVTLSYKIGVAQPSSFDIEIDDNLCLVDKIKETIAANIGLTPREIIDRFHLCSPCYYATARNGHYWEPSYEWEKLDMSLIEKLSNLKKCQ